MASLSGRPLKSANRSSIGPPSATPRPGLAQQIVDQNLRVDLLLDIQCRACTIRSDQCCSSLPRQTSCGSRSRLRLYGTAVGLLSLSPMKGSCSAVGILRRLSLCRSASIEMSLRGMCFLAPYRWMIAVRPSRPRCARRLRMRRFFNAIKDSPYPEERSAGSASRRRHRRSCSALRQPGQRVEIASDERRFLVASPAFHLPLGGHGILDALEILMEAKGYWPTTGGVAVERAGFVLGDPRFQTVARCTDTVGAVGAMQNVQVSTHAALPAM